MESEPAYHFTYAKPEGDLAQGDLIAKTDDVRDLLERVHPHYVKDDYTHLLVLTQTCDLVRRKGGAAPKARYVSVAAVRPLALLLARQLEKHQDEFARRAGVCSKGKDSQTKRELQEFVSRLLNNNEPDFFYLEPELTAGFAEASAAFLRLSIAVRAGEHYDRLLAARRLSLDSLFQAKLGWLVGNMYSRVGTPDWVPEKIATNSQFAKKIDNILGEHVVWVDDEQMRFASASPPIEGTREALRAHVLALQPPKPLDRVVDAVLEVLARRSPMTDDESKRIRQQLRNDPTLAALLR